MLTTGLLSLNIHEALTFEGAELCLHPDLFVDQEPGSGNNSQQTRGTHSKDDGKTGSTAASQAALQQQPSLSSSPGLTVGDMIEIRVWDPFQKEAARSPSASVVRKTVPRQSPPTSVAGGSSPAPAVPLELNAQPPVPSARSRSQSNTLGSLQYSESENADQQSNDNMTTSSGGDNDRSVEKDSSNAVTAESEQPPAKSILATPSSLPPVFPRGRANTHDVVQSKPPKPLPLHRRVPSTSNAIHPSSSSTPSKSPKLIRHSRDISDMTVDTHMMDIPHAESHDDENDELSKMSTTHKLRLSFVLLVSEKTLTSLKGSARTQVSMLRQVADLYNLSSYDMVTVHKIEAQDEVEVLAAVSADFVLVTIKDQFISRGDMHFFQKALVGTWIYEGQRLTEATRGIKAHAREIRHDKLMAKSGIVTENTMITFRSRSSRIVWLVQMSCEMWDFAPPYDHLEQRESICEIYFDQWIRFIQKLFTCWKELEVTHSLTVVYHSRTFLSNGKKSCVDCKDVYGRHFEV